LSAVNKQLVSNICFVIYSGKYRILIIFICPVGLNNRIRPLSVDRRKNSDFNLQLGGDMLIRLAVTICRFLIIIIIIIISPLHSTAGQRPLQFLAISLIFGYSHPAPASHPAQIVTTPGLWASYTTRFLMTFRKPVFPLLISVQR
jgi:hypothetical protein